MVKKGDTILLHDKGQANAVVLVTDIFQNTYDNRYVICYRNEDTNETGVYMEGDVTIKVLKKAVIVIGENDDVR